MFVRGRPIRCPWKVLQGCGGRGAPCGLRWSRGDRLPCTAVIAERVLCLGFSRGAAHSLFLFLSPPHGPPGPAFPATLLSHLNCGKAGTGAQEGVSLAMLQLCSLHYLTCEMRSPCAWVTERSGLTLLLSCQQVRVLLGCPFTAPRMNSSCVWSPPP